MVNSSIAKRIVNAFEMLAMTPDQIAEKENVAVSIVKSVLFQSSSVFRKDAKKDKTIGYSEDEAQEMMQLVLKQARESEDEHLVAKNAKWVIDEFKGRHETADAGMKQLGNINVLNFNMMHNKALQAIERTEKKAIEINSSITSNEEISMGK